MANDLATRIAPPFPPHYVLQRGGRYLVDAFGATVPSPFPLALNFCIKSEAEDLADCLNAGEPTDPDPWTLETINLAAICAAEVDLAGTFVDNDLKAAA